MEKTLTGHFVRKNSMNPNHPEEDGLVSPSALKKLNRAIMASKITRWKVRDASGNSNDCVMTTFRLEVCGKDGKCVCYSGNWDISLPMPADLEAVLAAMEF